MNWLRERFGFSGGPRQEDTEPSLPDFEPTFSEIISSIPRLGSLETYPGEIRDRLEKALKIAQVLQTMPDVRMILYHELHSTQHSTATDPLIRILCITTEPIGFFEDAEEYRGAASRHFEKSGAQLDHNQIDLTPVNARHIVQRGLLPNSIVIFERERQ